MSKINLINTKFHRLYYQKPIIFTLGILLSVVLIFSIEAFLSEAFDFVGLAIVGGAFLILSFIEIATRKKDLKIFFWRSVLFCMIYSFLIGIVIGIKEKMLDFYLFHIANVGITILSSIIGIMWWFVWGSYRKKLNK